MTNKIMFLGGGLLALYIVNKLLGDNTPRTTGDLPDTADGSSSTISDAELKSITETAHGSMSGVGTDENTLFGILENLNGADLQRVYTEFGYRKYWLWSKAKYVGNDLTLFGWFRQELNSSEIDKMNKIWSKANMSI